MEIPHYVSQGANGVDTVVAFNPNNNTPIVEADSRHPHWSAILDGLASGDETVFDLFDVQGGLITRLQSLSDRVSYDGENILWDGDPVDSSIANQIQRCLEQGVGDYAPLVKFWEKVAQNPDNRSREQLFTWLQTHDFTITEDGDIVGYKSVADTPTGLLSHNSGTAWVDGKEITGKIPNDPGAIVTMPRSEVKNDPYTACHVGLHVGDWSYASTFGNRENRVILEVHVNPRDVVSIPVDSRARKMRCCRYKVVQRLGSHYNSAVRPAGNLVETKWAGDVGYAPV